MFSKIKKYIIGFFVLAGGILVAFLSGKGAGRKEEKLGGLKDKIKETDKSIKETEKNKKAIKKTLENKKEALKEIEKEKKSFKSKKIGADDAADFLKKYSKKNK